MTTTYEFRARSANLTQSSPGQHGDLGSGAGRRLQIEDGAVVALIGAAAAAIAVAYAARAAAPWSLPLFWSGQIALFAVAAYGVLRRNRSEAATVAVLAAVALGTYLAKVSYSPLQFTYPDELQHVRSLNALLAHHHLFYANPSLPVSPLFPGLEIVTEAVMRVTTLSAFPAGLVVAGFAHLTLTLLMYALFRALLRSSSAAGIATIIFATEPHFEYFDAIFGYQTLALPLLSLSLLAAVKLKDAVRGGDQWRWGCVSAFSAAALLFTHHVSMLALLVFLLILAVVAARQGVWRCAVLLALCSLGTIAWFATGAHAAIGYLFQPIAENLLSALPGHAAGATTHGSAVVAPLADRLLAYLAVISTLALLIAAWTQTLRRWSETSAGTRTFAIAAISYPLVLAVRLFASDSSELAGRALTFAFIALAATVAPILERNSPVQRRRLVLPATILIVALLSAGGIVTGWPPWWERIPGTFKIDSFESGIDRENVAVARWAHNFLRANNHTASDFDTGSLMDTLGDQESELADAKLFYSPRLTSADWRQIRAREIHLFVIDRRMEHEKPAVGGYFAITPANLSTAGSPTRAAISKFARSSRFSRLYDSGNIVVYALSGTRLR